MKYVLLRAIQLGFAVKMKNYDSDEDFIFKMFYLKKIVQVWLIEIGLEQAPFAFFPHLNM